MNCILCSHEMSLRRCGYAAVAEGQLCHAADHSCYRRWTVYGERPGHRSPTARRRRSRRILRG